MDYRQAEEYIFGRRRMGMKFGLQRVRKLMEEVGDPQRSFRTIHVVGTNGKGSTTAMLSRLLEELGLTVGRMTSPHLIDFRERISMNGRWIPKESVIEFLETFKGSIESNQATFFEIATVMSAWHFSRCGVDVVVAEAGLGGRLDATRLLDGELTVFTGVEIEHRRILGSTEAAIATEKVAIARAGSILVAMEQKPEVEEVIGSAVSSRRLKRVLPEMADDAPLPGEHQRINAGLVMAAALHFGQWSRDEILRAYRNICRDFRWAGRIDLRRGDPPILFDVAHNPGSMSDLIGFLREGWDLPVTGIVGFLEDKFWREMTGQLQGVLDPVVTTTPLNERCLSAFALKEQFVSKGANAKAVDDIEKALEMGRELASGLLVVTGSFFVTGEAMKAAWRRGWIDLPETGDEQAQLFLSDEC